MPWCDMVVDIFDAGLVSCMTVVRATSLRPPAALLVTQVRRRLPPRMSLLNHNARFAKGQALLDHRGRAT